MIFRKTLNKKKLKLCCIFALQLLVKIIAIIIYFMFQCLSAESLVSYYGSDRSTISKSEFLQLCPVIIQQRVGDACTEPFVSLNLPSKLEGKCIVVLYFPCFILLNQID